LGPEKRVRNIKKKISRCSIKILGTLNMKLFLMIKMIFFVSTCSDAHFPISHVQALARIGSDHTPLCIHFGDCSLVIQKPFCFEKWWLEKEESK
jgi:hypothetical protein